MHRPQPATNPIMRPLRFIAVTHFPPRQGGSSRSCELLFRGMAARGHEVHVLAPITPETSSYDREIKSRMPELHSVERYPVPYFCAKHEFAELVRYRQIEDESISQRLPGLIERVRPDFLVCAHESIAGSVLEAAHAKGLRCPLLLRGSPTWQIVDGSCPAELAKIYLDLCASADVVIPVGRYMQDGLAARGLRNLHHIPNFVDTQQFSPGPRDDALLESYRIPPDSVVVLHVSLMHSRKRPRDLIESASMVLANAEKVFYLFVGGGARTAEFERIAQARGLGDRVRFVPNVPYEEIPRHIRLADIVAMASEGEGVSRVYLETQACGKVLISSDIPGAREVVDHGTTGLLFRTGDSADLATQVLCAAGDPVLREKIGAAAVERVRQYDIEQVIDRYLDLFAATSMAV